MSKEYKAVPYNELCRLCAQSTTRRIDIFGEEGRLREVAKNIQKLLCINVIEGDPLPKTICSFCLSRMEDFREFHSNCLSASQFLHLKLPAVEKASGKCYVSVGVPVRPSCLRRKMSRHLKAPIELGSTPIASTDVDLASTNIQDEEEVEVREYEECVQQPKSSEEYNADVFLKLLEDTMNTDCLLQDHDYLSIDELLAQDTPKKTGHASLGKHIGKVMPNQDHDYLSSYDNPMTPTVTHLELLDHNYFTSLGPFADNFVNLLASEEDGKFIEHNYFLPTATSQNCPQNFPSEKPPSPAEAMTKDDEIMDFVQQEQCELCGDIFSSFEGHECSADYERQCETCGDLFSTNSDFSCHTCIIPTEDSILKRSKNVQCEVCGDIFKGSNHHNCLADFDRQCHKCGLVFHTHQLFDEHGCVRKIVKCCNFCCEKFKSRKRLKEHIADHLEDQFAKLFKGPFTCKICRASYHRLAFYKQHVLSHELTNLKLCNDNLEVGSNSKFKLNFEISSQPNETQKIEFKCEQCYKQFSNNCNLALHRRLHTRSFTKFTCEICSSKFIKQSDYCKHVSTHLVSHKFPCDECSKGFETKKEWDNHKTRHNANRKIRSVLKAKRQNNVIV